jgi:hypothetical protein
VAALVVLLINALVNVGQWTSAAPDRAWGFVLALLGVGATVAACYFGWTMVQKRSRWG